MDDLISRYDAIVALWNALFEYEDKTEKQFLDSDELDIRDWMVHRLFVQNMNDIDRDVIIGLPSVQPKIEKKIIQRFHDYQIEWLKSHYDIELEPQLEDLIVQFLHDTANCYMMEVDELDEQI